MAKRATKPARKPAKPLTQALPAAQVIDGTDDPMADPIEPADQDENDDDEDAEIFDPELSSDEEVDEEDGLPSDDEGDSSDTDMDDGGAPLTTRTSLSPSAAIPHIGLPTTTPTDPTSANSAIHVTKPTPYTYDAGHLLITDPNPLPTTTSSTLEQALTSTARDAAQSLLNHLLTTCPIHTATTTSTSTSGVSMTLPAPIFPLPREKKVPVPKAPTKWERFAAKKGIGSKNKMHTGAGDGDRAGKMVYDQESGEWVPKWGYKGKNKKGEGEWLVEVDDKATGKSAEKIKAGADPRAVGREERKERVRRNERLQRANERKGRKAGA